MFRLILLLQIVSTVALSQPSASQCVVALDSATNRVYSTCTVTTQGISRDEVYLGTAFYTFPTWKPGTLRVDQLGQEIRGEMAYNLTTGVVSYRTDSQETGKTITPQTFTIDNTQFTRMPVREGHNGSHVYCMTLYRGPTKLFAYVNRYLILSQPGGDGYTTNNQSKGFYQTKYLYYVQKGDAPLKLLTLDQRGILSALYEYADQLAARLPQRKLTTDDMIAAIQYHDSLTVINGVTQNPLNSEPVFTQFLRERLKYPSQAWTHGAYSRVYAGFEVDQRGQVTNVTVLSPTETEFGFASIVKQAIRKLPVLNPNYAGSYVLPVSFTFTNQANGNQSTYTPVNTLPADLLQARVVLNEITVRFSTSKPLVSSREVWGETKQ